MTSPAPNPTASPLLLPPPFNYPTAAEQPTLISQGAEALLYKTHFLTPARPCALKFRPSKSWRHPTLDARLTRHRILAEARILVKCRREGLAVPGVLGLDWEGGELGDQEGAGAEQRGGREGARRSGGWMVTEWIDGATVRAVLERWTAARKARGLKGVEGRDGAEWDALLVLLKRVGALVGKMHAIGVVHGDLTTSNLMLRSAAAPLDGAVANGECAGKDAKVSLDGEVVLIDFGLASQSLQEEDRAVDLYVLERAFGSTHPGIEDVFFEVLEGYREAYKGAKVTLKKLDEVRLRGRKKSMIG